MLGGVWNFIKRHRRKIIVTGAVVGGIVLLGRYAREKLQEFQDREAAEYLAHVKKEHHFESNQRTCNTTVLSMVPSLRDAIRRSLHTEEITSLLKAKPENKLDLWEELKVKSFTRMFVCVYGSCLLVSVLRVKLNLMGGYIFIDNLLSRTGLSTENRIATAEVQRRYLEQVHYVMDKGLDDLISAVLKAADGIVRSIDLRSQVSLLDLEYMVRKMRQELEEWPENGYHDNSTSSLCRFIMPHQSSGPQGRSGLCGDDLTMERLTSETQDVVDNADFTAVLTVSLDRCFNLLLDNLAEHFDNNRSAAAHQSEDQIDQKMPMAKLIPIVDGMIHVVLSDMPNPFLKDQLLMEQGKDFAASIYETFSQVDRVVK